jgi:DNA invertase Pin-like site-specific DNA recombinase
MRSKAAWRRLRDNPHANKLIIHILEAVAENEREAISERGKAALAAAKARKTDTR